MEQAESQVKQKHYKELHLTAAGNQYKPGLYPACGKQYKKLQIPLVCIPCANIMMINITNSDECVEAMNTIALEMNRQ